MNFIREQNISFQGYRYELGDNFLKMRMRLAQSVEEVQLRVWEKPQPNAKYVIGVDPAFGSSEEADSTVISVWRCFSDKLVQVAEYASPITTTQNCAWVLGHLAGEYRDCMINLEYHGGGGEVAMEMKHLRQSIQFGGLMNVARDMKVEHALDSARWFYWRRPDSIGGQPSAHHFTTNGQNKPIALNRMNDAYISNQLIVRSVPLLEEMTTMKREGDRIAASGRNKDDRVMSGMLAVLCVEGVDSDRDDGAEPHSRARDARAAQPTGRRDRRARADHPAIPSGASRAPRRYLAQAALLETLTTMTFSSTPRSYAEQSGAPNLRVLGLRDRIYDVAAARGADPRLSDL